MPFEGLHDELIPLVRRMADELPPRPTFDFHMHSGAVEATGEYVAVARALGVCGACDLTGETDPAALAARWGGFFLHGFWPRPDTEAPGAIDWAAFRRRWVEGFEGLLAAGARFMKLKTAPWPGRAPSVLPDDEHLDELLDLCARRGVPLQIHAAQPDPWWPRVYDPAICGAKQRYLQAVERMLDKHPRLICVSVHMGSSPEDPDYVEAMLERYPTYHLDTSATKWTARELSRRPQRWRDLMIRHSERFLFGSDLVVREGMPRDYYASRLVVQRLMWETAYAGPSPIQDADAEGGPQRPAELRGLELPEEVLGRLYRGNALRLLGETASETA